MLNFLHDPIPITLSNVFTLVTDKKRRYHVTHDEQSLVLKAYEELNGDWEKMVEYTKDVMRILGGYMKKFKWTSTTKERRERQPRHDFAGL